ncbi:MULTISPECIES: hypothetical protein [unclassified Microcella]|uniref:hypothetical protein n=1 Tax=unclassified Microcella TaxID=2630066 RepID=UPI0006FC163C|nr:MULTISPECIES: hypothetical protein [unclassified Microcella]KQV25746.1 hypothetical protein ASC54_01810 [Yonghaparkia sp. Root332]KRF33445.1 hypothetical protein ASG83_05820 [Yonghaparkia sp. Soil809]
MDAILLWNIAYAAIPLVALAVIIVTVTIRRRRIRAAIAAAGGEPSGAPAARVIGMLAFIYGLGASFAAFIGLVVTISMTTSRVQGAPGSSALTLPVPISPASVIPESVLRPPVFDGQLIGSGYFTEISIPGAGLSLGTELLYVAPMLLAPVLHAIVAFGIASLASRIEKNEGFAPELARTATVVGVSLVAIGSASQVLHGYGVSLARHELLAGTELGGWIGPGPLDVTHIAAGVGVLLVGVLLRRGVRLERETAGLV